MVGSSRWVFAKWEIDLMGPLPKEMGSASYVIVTIDYFIKWVEDELLAKITEANTLNFISKNIVFNQ